MVRVYLLVEGPHDVEFIGRLLKWWACKRIQLLKRVDPFWHPLIPKVFPHLDDLLARVPVPTFFETTDLQVAVSVAVGDSKIARILRADLTVPSFCVDELDAIGLVLDADDKTPRDRWQALSRAIQLPPNLHMTLPAEPNTVARANPRFGALVLPGDGTRGSLEDLLIACGKIVYPQLLRKAQTYVRAVDGRARRGIGSAALTDFDTSSGRKKALFAAMTAPLRPGKAMQVSIQDNRWLSEATRELPSVRACLSFMAALLGRAPSVHVIR